MEFIKLWSESAVIAVGFFWKAMWAFILGYAISGMIQVFVTRRKMRAVMGDDRPKSIFLGSFFGFISSSCSFAALAATKSLLKKGAGFISSLAFLLASTNLVIELGFVIAVFMGWQFVVGEYAGGVLLILFMAILVSIFFPDKLLKKVRKRLGNEHESEDMDDSKSWRQKVFSVDGWQQVAKRFFMEWKMVWKDITIGFTVAGIIAAMVPKSFFQTLFIGAGSGDPGFFALLEQALVGPVAAFFTFIGSMGNIPLASVLLSNGVSFAGVMAFIFSDLVVFPVLRINAKYYGWRMSMYILSVFLVILISTSLILHGIFAALGALPDPEQAILREREFFNVDFTLFMNAGFMIVFMIFLALVLLKNKNTTGHMHHHKSGKRNIGEKALLFFSSVAILWLIGGLIAKVML